MRSVSFSRRFFLRTLAGGAAGLVIPGLLPRRLEAAFRTGEIPSPVVLNDLRGNRVVIPSDFRGRVVVIHFWASWCPTCRGEMRALQLLYGAYTRNGVTACSIGLGEKRETALAYLKDLDVSYPVLLDPESSTKKPFGVAGIPTYFILNREGSIRHRILGKADGQGLERIIRSLL